LALLRSADGVVADISPFRGPHADDGTAWEIGFACALDTPVFAWTRDADPLAWRIEGSADADGILRDAQGYAIEDFGAPANLMIVEACRTISATPEDAIASAARHFQTHLKPV
jgi:nucleoside 2-deoxyribosyltransferase